MHELQVQLSGNTCRFILSVVYHLQVFDEAALAVVLEQYLPGSDAATGLQAEVLNSAAWPLAPGT